MKTIYKTSTDFHDCHYLNKQHKFVFSIIEFSLFSQIKYYSNSSSIQSLFSSSSILMKTKKNRRHEREFSIKHERIRKRDDDQTAKQMMIKLTRST